VLCFKLDDKTIYAWFHEDLKPLSSSFKKKAHNNFGHIQHKECLVEVEDGKSQRIASNLKTDKPKSKPRKSKKGLPPIATVLPSNSLTSTIESNSYRQYLIEDFLFSTAGWQSSPFTNCLGSSTLCLLLEPLQEQRAQASATHLRTYLHATFLCSYSTLTSCTTHWYHAWLSWHLSSPFWKLVMDPCQHFKCQQFPAN
jgi:hypothetical protein